MTGEYDDPRMIGDSSGPDVQLRADGFKLHASEKVSTGEYESADYHVTVEGDVDGATAMDEGTRRLLKARLLSVQKELQEVVERAAENRIANPEFEDWGVTADDDA